MPYDQTKGFCCRVSWPIFLALRRPEGILPIPRSGDGTTLAAVLVTTPTHPNPSPPVHRSTPPHHTTGEGDSFLAAAARPEPDRHASARRGAGAVSARTRPASLRGRIWWLPRQARVGWPSSTFVSREQAPGARHRLSLSPVATVCCAPASFLVPREGRCCRSVHRWIIRQNNYLGDLSLK
ncbi:hypothetical protein PVAP13_1KG528150, partial [Panicum virgatum]